MPATLKEIVEGLAARADHYCNSDLGSCSMPVTSPNDIVFVDGDLSTSGFHAGILVVTGRLNCDNRQIEVLDGMRPGALLNLACSSYLIVDASDAGALRISLPGRATVPLGLDGQSLSGHRIDMPGPPEGPRP